MDLEKKMSKVRSVLIMDRNAIFYRDLILKLPYQVEPSPFGTAHTDGFSITFDPTFVEEKTISQLCWTYCHEVLHVAFLHPFRKTSLRIAERDEHKHLVSNIAADLSMQIFLDKMGYDRPMDLTFNDELLQTIGYDPHKGGMSYEQIYKALLSILPEQGNQGQGEGDGTSGGDSEGDGNPGNGSSNSEGDQPGDKPGGGGSLKGRVFDDIQTPSQSKKSSDEEKRQETSVKNMVKAATNAAKAEGKLPGGMDITLGELYKPKVNYKAALHEFFTEKARTDWVWSKPNKRFSGSGLCMPSMGGTTLGQIVWMVDTSGSISDEDIRQEATELVSAVELYHQDTEVVVLWIDTKVQGVQFLQKDDIPDGLDPKGGGGTSYKPGFEWLEKNDLEPVAVVYLTDGYCSSYPKEPEFPVLWIVTENGDKDFNPPFGEVLHREK